MRLIPAIFIFVFIFAALSQAATFEELFQAGQDAYKAGDYPKAASRLKQAGDELQKKKDPHAPLLWGNAAVAMMKGEDYQGAADVYEKILALKNPPKDKLKQYYNNLIIARGELKQPALQLDAIARMLKAVPKLPPAELAEIYARQGDTYRGMKLYAPAVAAYDKALHSLPKDLDPQQKARLLTAAGLAQGNLGEYAAAEKKLSEAQDLAKRMNMPLTVAESASNLGILQREKGNYPEALTLLRDALDVEKKASLELSQARENINLGVVRASTGKFDMAMDHMEEALRIAKEQKDEREEAIALLNRAFLQRTAGNMKEAAADYDAASKLFDKIKFQEGKATALLGMGKMAELNDKNYAQALKHYTDALQIYSDLESPR